MNLKKWKKKINKGEQNIHFSASDCTTYCIVSNFIILGILNQIRTYSTKAIFILAKGRNTVKYAGHFLVPDDETGGSERCTAAKIKISLVEQGLIL